VSHADTLATEEVMLWVFISSSDVGLYSCSLSIAPSSVVSWWCFVIVRWFWPTWRFTCPEHSYSNANTTWMSYSLVDV